MRRKCRLTACVQLQRAQRISSADHHVFIQIITQLRNVACHHHPAFFGICKFCTLSACAKVCDVAVERATFPLSFGTKTLVWGSACPLNTVSWFRTTTSSLFWLHFNPHFESADFSRANSSVFFRCTLLYFWDDLRNSKFTGLLKAKDALFRQLITLYHLLWWWLYNCSF